MLLMILSVAFRMLSSNLGTISVLLLPFSIGIIGATTLLLLEDVLFYVLLIVVVFLLVYVVDAGFTNTTSLSTLLVKSNPSVDPGPQLPLFTITVLPFPALLVSPLKLPNDPLPPKMPNPNNTPRTMPAAPSNPMSASKIGLQHPLLYSSIA